METFIGLSIKPFANLLLRHLFLEGILLFKALRAVRRAIVESCCSVDDLSWKLFGRILYNIEAFYGQGASFGMLFGFILNPWGHFWSNFEPLESFLEHLVHIFWCQINAAAPKVPQERFKTASPVSKSRFDDHFGGRF